MGSDRGPQIVRAPVLLGRIGLLFLTLFFVVGCGDIPDDLFPSGSDRRPEITEGSTGNQPGQVAPDFTAPDAFGSDFILYEELPYSRAVVLYFTMWCPICDSHMSHLANNIIPLFPDVAFYVVDFVSGSVADARSLQTSHGFDTAGFTVLVDLEDQAEDLFEGTMGTTVVIDSTGLVWMNEDYRDGSNLVSTLDSIP